jgi:hypothetical protein
VELFQRSVRQVQPYLIHDSADGVGRKRQVGMAAPCTRQYGPAPICSIVWKPTSQIGGFR